jgi:hypothetical protein
LAGEVDRPFAVADAEIFSRAHGCFFTAPDACIQRERSNSPKRGVLSPPIGR